MSAFVMILATGMAVGNGSEAVSAEAELALDLRGGWKGTLVCKGKEMDAFWSDGVLSGLAPLPWRSGVRFAKEGEGKVQVSIGEVPGPGIYKWEGDRLILSYELGGRRPVSFLSCDDQRLLILHRVKPGK
jgi:hypothetical protein